MKKICRRRRVVLAWPRADPPQATHQGGRPSPSPRASFVVVFLYILSFLHTDFLGLLVFFLMLPFDSSYSLFI